MLYSRTLLFIRSIYNSLCLLTPNSQSIPAPPLGNHKSVLYVCESVQTFLGFSFNFIYLIYLFYFWLHWVFVAARRLSLVAASGGYSSLRCAVFSLWWLLLLRSTGSRRAGFSSCGTQAQQLWLTGSRAQAQ